MCGPHNDLSLTCLLFNSSLNINLTIKIFQDNIGGIASLPEDALVHRQRGKSRDNPDLKSIVDCFPLHSVLLAIGNPVIDLFSLDIEGEKFFETYYLEYQKL